MINNTMFVRERLEDKLKKLYLEELRLRRELAMVERKVNACASLIALADAQINERR